MYVGGRLTVLQISTSNLITDESQKRDRAWSLLNLKLYHDEGDDDDDDNGANAGFHDFEDALTFD